WPNESLLRASPDKRRASPDKFFATTLSIRFLAEARRKPFFATAAPPKKRVAGCNWQLSGPVAGGQPACRSAHSAEQTIWKNCRAGSSGHGLNRRHQGLRGDGHRK